jgi:hypothetical protein
MDKSLMANLILPFSSQQYEPMYIMAPYYGHKCGSYTRLAKYRKQKKNRRAGFHK